MEKSFALLFIIIAFVFLAFTACKNDDVTDNNILANNSNTLTETQSSQALKNETNKKTEKIEKNLQENLYVNAFVHVENTAFYTIEVSEQSINYNKAFDLLMKDKNVIEEINESQEGALLLNGSKSDFILKETRNGEFLAYNGKILSYGTEIYSQKIISSFHNEKTDYFYNADRFSKTDELPFIKRVDALKEVKRTLNELGVKVTKNYICYSLDYKTLDKEEQVINIKSTDNNQKHTYTADDDCYYFEFNMDVQGCPVSRIMHGNPDANNYFMGTSINIAYNKDGIIFLSINEPYQKINMHPENNVKIKTVDDALDSLNLKYDSVIITGEIEVIDIALHYLPQRYKDGNISKNRLIPSWVFEVKQKEALSKEGTDNTQTEIEHYFYVIFNAVTGKEII